jgi:hypothetical protein
VPDSDANKTAPLKTNMAARNEATHDNIIRIVIFKMEVATNK